MTPGLHKRSAITHDLRMRFYVFFSGTMILAFGVSAMRILSREEALPFLLGAVYMGGGIIICGLFSLKFKWHGLIGAGILGLLGAARGLGNIPDLIKLTHGDRQRGPAPMMELGVTLVCLLLLWRVLGALRRERARQLLDREQADQDKV